MKKSPNPIIIVIGLIAWLSALVLALIWFDWRLVVVIVLFLFANNLERKIEL